ncbi:hypothetical protein [Vibrio ulleungensis]|uniref:Uncharacterized protein n=1 Tax=Vibrio ulleungensis TaxID=2807619 RepID=A0ABS2HKK6_9VIBR|nr:hypothetical protein [Vibrio ulleungensis]MBM7036647.1 hypothetical protein [Vibrio ulleungensis]
MVVAIVLLLIGVGLVTDGLVSSISQLLAFLVLLLVTALKVGTKKDSSDAQ